MRRPLLALAASLFLAFPVLAQPPAAAASNGWTYTGASTYTLDPNAGMIRVTRDLTVKNNIPDRTSGGFITRTYIKFVPMYVEDEATDIKATANSGKVTTKVDSETTTGRVLELDFSAVVWYGQTRTIHVTYEIPGGKPRSSSAIRAGRAYAAFCATGAGLDGGSLSVVLPTGYTVVQDVAMSNTSSGGTQVYKSGNLSNASDFTSCFQATNQGAATHDNVTAAGQAFTVEAWPEDTQWAADVQEAIAADFSKLLDLTGLKVPGSGPIKAVEVSDVTWGGGYAGQYVAQDRALYAVEHVDAQTVVHELSHMWFNSNALAQNWMWEGLAGYAEEAAGHTCTDPGAWPGPGTADLTNWKILGNGVTKLDASIADFDYKASCWLFTDLAQQMGPDNFRKVLAAAWNNEIAYVGGGQPEAGPGGKLDAQRLLDLIDERGMRARGVADLDFAQKLFAQYGIVKDTAALAARSKARADYVALETAAAGWKLPLAIRQPMAEWRFDVAESAMQTANEIVGLRDQFGRAVSGVSLDGSQLQHEFEAATDQNDLDAVLGKARGLAGAASKVAAAQRAYDTGRGPIDSLGLLGTDVGGTMTTAKAALQNGNGDEAVAAADSVVSTLDGAGSAGIVRLGIILGCTLLLVLVLVLLAVLSRRRHRRAAALAAAAATVAVPVPGFAGWSQVPPPDQTGVWQPPAYPQPVYPQPAYPPAYLPSEPAQPSQPVVPQQPIQPQQPPQPQPPEPGATAWTPRGGGAPPPDR